MTEDRLTALEQLVTNLREVVEENQLLLHGNPNLGADTGVIPRLLALERGFRMIGADVRKTCEAVDDLRRTWQKERDMEKAIYADRNKWLKVAGVIFGVLSSAQAIDLVIKVAQALNSMP